MDAHTDLTRGAASHNTPIEIFTVDHEHDTALGEDSVPDNLSLPYSTVGNV